MAVEQQEFDDYDDQQESDNSFFCNTMSVENLNLAITALVYDERSESELKCIIPQYLFESE